MVLAGWARTVYKTGDWRPITSSVPPPLCLSHSKIATTFNPVHVRRKKILDCQPRGVVNRRASGLVRFSYKLSIFQIGSLVICGLEATGV